jgi:hypothetical protein
MISYTKNTYVDDNTSVPISAANLNKNEDAIDALVDFENAHQYKDYTGAMPSAGSTTNIATDITIANVRRIEAIVFNTSGFGVSPNFIQADGTRTSHYHVYADPAGNIVIQSDSTIDTGSFVGRTVYIRVYYV